MNQSNCIVAQSGGPTVAINASLAGVIAGVKSSEKYDICYGAVNGILGILNENYLNLSDIFADDANLEKLKTTPAMYLGSCRHKLPDYKDDDSPYVYIFHQFDKLSVKAFFYIGGNDSMDTVLKLSDYAKKINSDVKIIGIPKTIDNDLCMTDHTPGFGSAAKYIASSMLEIAHDTFIYAVKSVTIVEIMGRDAGWLTAASALARNEYNTAPQFIYLPEVNFDKDKFVADIKEAIHELQGLLTGQLKALQLQLFLADLAHLGLDLRQVVGGKGKGRVQIVVKAVVDAGADGQLHLRPQTLHRLRQNVGAGMPVRLSVLLVFKRVDVFLAHDTVLLVLGAGIKITPPLMCFRGEVNDFTPRFHPAYGIRRRS